MPAKRMTTRSSRSSSLPKAEPYYSLKSRSTRYSTKGDVYSMQMTKKAKRK